jgi:hypothetical protein
MNNILLIIISIIKAAPAYIKGIKNISIQYQAVFIRLNPAALFISFASATFIEPTIIDAKHPAIAARIKKRSIIFFI